MCGWEVVEPKPGAIAATRDHGRRVHNMDATDDEILAMAEPVADDGRAG